MDLPEREFAVFQGLYSRRVLDLARLKSSIKVKTFVSAKFCL